MFNNLSDKLDKAFHILKGHGKITEVNVAETLKEVRRALLDADVNFKIAKDFTTKVKEKAHNYSMRTVCGGQIQVEESKTYSVRIIKAYIHEGIEYCSMIIEGTGDKECNWVPYKKFRFI